MTEPDHQNTGTKTISIDIEPQMLAKIDEIFDTNDRAKTHKAFAELALQHFTEWITGAKRYRSLTEQYIDWVESVYEKLLPEEQPSTDLLYNSFNISYGQAMYISRVLRDKQLPHWKELAQREIVKVLRVKQQTAKQSESHENIYITLSIMAERELQRICKRIRTNDDTLLFPVRKGQREGDFQKLGVPASTLLRVLEDLN